MTASKTSEENRKTMPHGRSRCRWKGNVKMDLGEMGCQTGQNSSVPVQCQKDMNLTTIYGAGNLYISYGTISTIDSVQ